MSCPFRSVLAGAFVALLALAGTTQATADLPTNLLNNPSAEEGAPGQAPPAWEAASWTARRFDSAGEHPDAGQAAAVDAGSAFFQPEPGENLLRQHVTLSAASFAQIDAQAQVLTFGGLFGGWQHAEDSATMSATPMDANGAPLGPTKEAGAPSAADRGHETRLMSCSNGFSTLPVGTRSLRIDVRSTGTRGIADKLWVVLGQIAGPAVFPVAKGCAPLPSGSAAPAEAPAPADAPAEPPKRSGTTRATTPRLSSVLIIRKRENCSRKQHLALRVSPRWRTKVRSVRALRVGKRTRTWTAREILKGVRLPTAGKRAEVRWTVQLHDGRSIVARRSYRLCA